MVLETTSPRGIGAMRDRVTILRPLFARDAGGAMTKTYTSVAERWCYVEQLSARERLIAAAERARISGRISLRYFQGLTDQHRLMVGERHFEIVGLVNPDGRKIEHVADVIEIPGPN